MIQRLIPLVLAIGLLLAYFRWRVGPSFLTEENLIDLAQQVTVNAILALGITFTILIGGIDLAVGSTLALSGTVAVYLLTSVGGSAGGNLRALACIVAGLGVAATVGLINGLFASRTRMPAFIITLAMMLVARGTALGFNQARPMNVPVEENLFIALGNHRIGGFLPVPVVVLAVVFAVVSLLLHSTRFGQHLYAVGGNRQAARYTGLPIARLELSVYMLSSILAGIGGMIQTSQLYMASPTSGEGYELNAIAAAVVGGTSFQGGVATTYGTLLGAIIFGILAKGLNQEGVHFSQQYVVKGLVILAAVYMDVRRQRN